MNRDSIIALTVAFLVLIFVFLQSPTSNYPIEPVAPKTQFAAVYGTPLLDGIGSDDVWQSGPWLALDQAWIGSYPMLPDFTGRYKIAWDENNLYLLAEIVDDTLVDTHPDGLSHFWDDDCLEIFIDEDASGGIHQYNYNAFAYHIALDGKVTDTAPDSTAHYYNDHCTTRRVTTGKRSVWEVAIKIFGDKYTDTGENIPKLLKANKKMGFALAYCDNDYSKERENFMGNVFVKGEDKNQGWIDASIFGVLTLQ